jgi:hypothetical protein
MERAVWVCACALALSLAVGISSISSASQAKVDTSILEVTQCKTQSSCKDAGIKPLGRTSEMFLRKVKRLSRKAFA